jgi:hypothetical protein
MKDDAEQWMQIARGRGGGARSVAEAAKLHRRLAPAWRRGMAVEILD